MPRPTRTAFVVRRPSTPSQWTGFLDMLRYDACTVLDHTSDLVVLTTRPGYPPTPGRWASFNLHVLSAAPLDTSGLYPTPIMAEARAKLPAPSVVRP